MRCESWTAGFRSNTCRLARSFISTFFAALALTSVGFADETPVVQPGRKPPREIISRVEPLLRELETALVARRKDAVKATCRKMTEALGRWAANPEAAPRYFQPVERDEPNIDQVRQLWSAIDRRTRPTIAWVVSPDGDPRKLKTGLRCAGRPILAYATMVRVDPRRKDEYLPLIRTGADYLLQRQRDDGLFPFPDVRGRHPLFGPMLDRLLKQHPDAIVDGWLVEDGGKGGLYYDNGICGVALVEAYEATNDRRYLEAARRSSEWAAAQPLCTNWNYNAFTLWLLARYARATGERKYLEQAVEWFEIGVLPGQLESGRWLDPHNARLVYHAIIVRGMLELHRALPENHKVRAVVADSLRRAIDNAATQIRTHGASSNATTTEMLSRAILVLGADDDWREALNININAGLHVMQNRRAPNVGIYLPAYLEYKMTQR